MKKRAKNIKIPPDIIEIWQRLIDFVSEILSIPSISINRVDPPEPEVFRSSINRNNPFTSGTRVPLLGAYCETTARTENRLQVEDARKDPSWADSPTAKFGLFSYLGYPLFWPDGEVFGTICAVDTAANKWISPSDLLLRTVKDAVEAHLSLVDSMEKLKSKNRDLKAALKEVKKLKGLLPICSYCKKIRDDKGYWNQLESYISSHSDTKFSHGICPECLKKEMQKIK